MTTVISERVQEKRGSFTKRFNWNYWLQDNITGSRGLSIWIGVLSLVTLFVLVQQLTSAAASGRATIIFVVWLVMVAGAIIGELFNLHIGPTRWLKENLIGTVSNALVTLLLALLVGIVFAGLWDWGVVRATFSPDKTHPDVRSTGASWGVIWAARKLWLTGPLSPDHNWRVFLATGLVAVLGLVSFISSRQSLKESLRPVARITNFLWLLAPFAVYMILAGAEIPEGEGLIVPSRLLSGVVVALALMAVLWFFKVIKLTPTTVAAWVLAWPIAYAVWRFVASLEIFTPINVDDWGGLLLTVIFAIFVNILSLPIGVMLALGRRADVQGIPWWLVWPIAIAATLYYLMNSTPELWETSRNNFERAIALWPLLIVIAAYYFMKSFNGNLVQAFSVLFIEIIRGVPLITLLFMAIVMSPFFTESGTGVKSFWAVIVGYTIFSSAYMAELVRGGLQAIPRGQYEAADSLGFNVLQKYRFIVLPQALRILIPPLAGSVISTFKSSSLVALVGQIDLVGATRSIIANADWLGLRTELYVFMFVLYFVVSSVISWYSRRLEERTGLGVR